MSWPEIFDRFANMRVLVTGDVMLDRYLTGSVSRISPEAPVPVLEWQGEEERPGGAANVALNIIAMGASAMLCGVTGNDADGDRLIRMLCCGDIAEEGIIRSANRKTTVKTRVLAGGQHLLRFDREDVFDLLPQELHLFLQRIRELVAVSKPDVVILQDYNKGVLSAAVITELLQLFRREKIPVCVDPKNRNFWVYQGVALFKPNLKEVAEALGASVLPGVSSLRKASTELRRRLNYYRCLITLSDKGLWLDGDEPQLYPTWPRTVADVSGAGDTVAAVAALGVAVGLPEPALALLANVAGSQVVEKIGVVPVDRDQLLQELLSKEKVLPGV